MTPEEGIDQLTEEIYRSFVEGEDLDTCVLRDSWGGVESRYGKIESGSSIDMLFQETIRYTVGYMVSNIANAIVLEQSEKNESIRAESIRSCPECDGTGMTDISPGFAVCAVCDGRKTVDVSRFPREVMLMYYGDE